MSGERIFVGSRMQRGYGLGGFFASLFRRALPLFKSGGEYLVKKATKTGLHAIQDIASGVNPRQALKRRIADVSDEMLDEVKRKIRRKMEGRGIGNKKRITLKKKTNVKRRRVNKKLKDIFDK